MGNKFDLTQISSLDIDNQKRQRRLRKFKWKYKDNDITSTIIKFEKDTVKCILKQ